jgi:hypothetical protein
MLLDWPRAFELQLERLDAKVAEGDEHSILIKELVDAQMQFLMNDVKAPPEKNEETKQLRWVRQSKKNQVWRVSHEYIPGTAVRTIIWFPTDGQAVILLLYADKGHMGDVFYDSVGERADQLIAQYLKEIGSDVNA